MYKWYLKLWVVRNHVVLLTLDPKEFITDNFILIVLLHKQMWNLNGEVCLGVHDLLSCRYS